MPNCKENTSLQLPLVGMNLSPIKARKLYSLPRPEDHNQRMCLAVPAPSQKEASGLPTLINSEEGCGYPEFIDPDQENST